MKFNPIDFASWPRAALFKFYLNDMRCVMTLTANVDVTALVCACKNASYRFYPSFIYIVSTIVNNRTEFRTGYDNNGQPGIWDVVWPSYIVFHADYERFTRLVTPYTPDFQAFYADVVADMARHESKRGFETGPAPPNIFDISCLPWLHYNALDFHMFDEGKYLAPVITWGKYTEINGLMQMPLTLQIHHAAADGFHAARFFTDVEQAITALAAMM